MATAGKVVVTLSARTARFARAMKRAGARVAAFGASIARVARRVAQFGAALVAAAAVGLALIVRRQLVAIDTLAKLSRNLGIATEQLQALRLAANIGGISTSILDKALKRLAKSIGDLGNKLSTQVRAFERLGLSIDDLKGKSLDEAFKIIADAAAAVGPSVERTAAIMDIFGTRIGADLVAFLAQGRVGIEAFEQEIRDLGLELSNVDAAQVEAANDAWTRFKGILTGVAQVLTVQLAPFIEAGITALIKWGKSGVDASESVAGAINIVGKGFVRLAQGLNLFNQGWIRLKILVQEITIGFQRLFDFFLGAAPAELLRTEERKLRLLNEELERGRQAGEDLSDAFDGIDKKFDDIREAARKAAEEAAKIPKALEPIVDPEDIIPEIQEPEPGSRRAVAQRVAEERRRQGAFGEADLRTLAFGQAGGVKAATEKSAKLTNDILKQIKEAIKEQTDKPVKLAFE